MKRTEKQNILQRRNPVCLTVLPHRERISEILFMICSWAYLAESFAMNTTFRQTYGVKASTLTMRIVIPLIIISLLNILLLEDYSIGSMLLIYAACAVFYVSWKHRGDIFLLSMFSIFFSGRYAGWKRYIRATLALTAAGILAVVLMGRTGILTDLTYYRGEGSTPRPGFGFGHPNWLAGYTWALTAMYVMVRFDRWKPWEYLIPAAAAVFCLLVPNSRTNTVLLLLLIPGVMLFRHFRGASSRHRVLRVLLCLPFPLCAGISFWFGKFCPETSRILQTADNLLSNRLTYLRFYMENYSVTLWGQRVKYNTEIWNIFHPESAKQPLILDNAYGHILLQSGAVPFVILIVFLVCFTAYLLRHGYGEVAMILVIMALCGLSEYWIVRVPVNPAIFAIPLFAGQRTKEIPAASGRHDITSRGGTVS